MLLTLIKNKTFYILICTAVRGDSPSIFLSIVSFDNERIQIL